MRRMFSENQIKTMVKDLAQDGELSVKDISLEWSVTLESQEPLIPIPESMLEDFKKWKLFIIDVYSGGDYLSGDNIGSGLLINGLTYSTLWDGANGEYTIVQIDRNSIYFQKDIGQSTFYVYLKPIA